MYTSLIDDDSVLTLIAFPLVFRVSVVIVSGYLLRLCTKQRTSMSLGEVWLPFLIYVLHPVTLWTIYFGASYKEDVFLLSQEDVRESTFVVSPPASTGLHFMLLESLPLLENLLFTLAFVFAHRNIRILAFLTLAVLIHLSPVQGICTAIGFVPWLLLLFVSSSTSLASTSSSQSEGNVAKKSLTSKLLGLSIPIMIIVIAVGVMVALLLLIQQQQQEQVPLLPLPPVFSSLSSSSFWFSKFRTLQFDFRSPVPEMSPSWYVFSEAFLRFLPYYGVVFWSHPFLYPIPLAIRVGLSPSFSSPPSSSAPTTLTQSASTITSSPSTRSSNKTFLFQSTAAIASLAIAALLDPSQGNGITTGSTCIYRVPLIMSLMFTRPDLLQLMIMSSGSSSSVSGNSSSAHSSNVIKSMAATITTTRNTSNAADLSSSSSPPTTITTASVTQEAAAATLHANTTSSIGGGSGRVGMGFWFGAHIFSLFSSPSMKSAWLSDGIGNANFMFNQHLLFTLASGTLVAEFVSAALRLKRRERAKEKEGEEKKKE